MKRVIVWSLRLAVLFLAWLPVFVPALREPWTNEVPNPIVLIHEQDLSTEQVRALRLHVERKFGGERPVETRPFGTTGDHPLARFEDLARELSETRSTVVVAAHPWLWGPAAEKFNVQLNDLVKERSQPIYWLDPASPSLPATARHVLEQGTAASQEFLAVNEVFLPSMAFLGDESEVEVRVLGRLPAGRSEPVEVVVRVGDSVLGAGRSTVVAGEKGVVDARVRVPVHFVTPGTQVISATLMSPLARAPLHVAATTVSVAHARTTVLHIAYGPDWSVRSFRQKMKFWPNLDLLSYYILRDLDSDATVPVSELSLIEFPADKLFGEQLPSFHGLVIQNFPIDAFLRQDLSSGIVKYVNEGGRVLLLAGPLSFLSQEPDIRSLFPCENEVGFDFQKTYEWVTAGKGELVGASDFLGSLSSLRSGTTAINCKPKPETLVLARTREGNHPVLTARQVGKGLVVTALAGDWHTHYSEYPIGNPVAEAERVREAEASERVLSWLVEFLQRRQDGGMRPPDLAGPRLYRDDRLFLVRSRGLGRTRVPLSLKSESTLLGSGDARFLRFLGLESFVLNDDSEGLRSTAVVAGEGDAPVRSLHLEFGDGLFPARRAGLWPIFPGRASERERVDNPLVFAGIPVFGDGADAKNGNERMVHGGDDVPLIEALPFLMALALGLLAIEEFLVHVIWRREFVRSTRFQTEA